MSNNNHFEDNRVISGFSDEKARRLDAELNEYCADSAFDKAKPAVAALTNEQRLELFAQYCTHCGRPLAPAERCHCSNDE